MLTWFPGEDRSGFQQPIIKGIFTNNNLMWYIGYEEKASRSTKQLKSSPAGILTLTIKNLYSTNKNEILKKKKNLH